MSEMILPNFLIIGGHKCGTTSLYEHLRPHPQVFMPRLKEPSFFTFEGQNLDAYPNIKRNVVTRFEEYAALFADADGKIAVGEASPMYLKCSASAPRIKGWLPNVRLIAILRNPVDRAYSHFQMEFRNGTVKSADFMQAMQEFETLPDGLRYQRYIHDGQYFTLLKPYFDLFGAENILVLLFDKMRSDPTGLMRSVYQFLRVEPDFTPDLSEKHNEGGIWRSPLWRLYYRTIYPAFASVSNALPESLHTRLATFGKKLRKSAIVRSPELSPQVRSELNKIFHGEIVKLQDLIQQDLSDWLEVEPGNPLESLRLTL